MRFENCVVKENLCLFIRFPEFPGQYEPRRRLRRGRAVQVRSVEHSRFLSGDLWLHVLDVLRHVLSCRPPSHRQVHIPCLFLVYIYNVYNVLANGTACCIVTSINCGLFGHFYVFISTSHSPSFCSAAPLLLLCGTTGLLTPWTPCILPSPHLLSPSALPMPTALPGGLWEAWVEVRGSAGRRTA